MKKIFLIIFVALIYLDSCTHEKGPLPIKISSTSTGCDTIIHYSSTIVAIINTNCAISHCHKAGSMSPADYSTYALLKPHIDNGALLNRVVTLKNMPASGPLSDADISKINCWIQQGYPNN